MGFIFWAMGCRSPKFSMLFQLGPITLSTGIGFPIFCQLLFILVNLHLFVPKFFSVLVLFTTIFAVFMLRATCSTRVMGLSEQDAATTKNESSLLMFTDTIRNCLQTWFTTVLYKNTRVKHSIISMCLR